jgi:hypothetical protein
MRIAKAAKRLLKAVTKDEAITSLSVAAAPVEPASFVVPRSTFGQVLSRIDDHQNDSRWRDGGNPGRNRAEVRRN